MARKATSKPESSNSTASIGFASGMVFGRSRPSLPGAAARRHYPKIRPQSLLRQRNINRAPIETDLVECMVAFPVLWN